MQPFSPTTWGARLTGLWLVLNALFVIIGLTFDGLPILMAMLGLFAGILLIFGK